MSRILIAYASSYGQTSKIAHRIASTLRCEGSVVEVCDVAQSVPERSLEDYSGVIVGSPLYAKRHIKAVRKFVAEHQAALSEMPSAFYSVSLSASGNEQQRHDARLSRNEFLNDANWHPARSEIFAGSLMYCEYGFWLRLMMKVISWRAGGDTDTSQNYEYTDWDSVEQFAVQCLNDFETSEKPAAVAV